MEIITPQPSREFADKLTAEQVAWLVARALTGAADELDRLA
jgi:hypothetical protein